MPVGLTKYREKLPKLTPYDAAGAREVISIVDGFREKMKTERGIAVAYAADEFFIKAGLPLPPYEYYDDFTQLEDGVGLCTLLKHEFYEALDYFPPAEYNRRVTIPTGKAAYSTIKELADAAERRYDGLKIDVLAMENNFFGELITVTGLLTGGDIVAQLKERDNGDAVLIMREAPDMNIDFYIPDKTSIFIDSMCIPATSTNSEAAELYINYMCEATVAAANSYYVGYSTPIHAAYELLDKDLQENTIAYPDPEFLGSLDAFLTLPEDISSLMDEYWTEILAASNSVWIYAAALVAVIGGAAAFMTVKKNKRKKMDY